MDGQTRKNPCGKSNFLIIPGYLPEPCLFSMRNTIRLHVYSLSTPPCNTMASLCYPLRHPPTENDRGRVGRTNTRAQRSDRYSRAAFDESLTQYHPCQFATRRGDLKRSGIMTSHDVPAQLRDGSMTTGQEPPLCDTARGEIVRILLS